MNYLIIAFIVGVFLIEVILDLLNNQYKEQPLPKNVQDIYDEVAYKNWRHYQSDLFKIGLLNQTISITILLGFLVFNGFSFLEELSRSVFNNILLVNLLFLGIYFSISALFHLPISYYKTFVIEEKYGFNKTTKKTFITDRIKGLILTLILGGGLIILLNQLFIIFETNIIVFMVSSWAVLMTIILIVSYLNTRVFIKIFNKLTPLESGELKDYIESLVQEIGFKVRGIYIMDASKRSTKLNAFFSGFGKNKEIVLFDTLIEKLSKEEIGAVLAHEFGHAVHKDVLRLMIQQAIIFFIYTVTIGLVLTWDQLAIAFNLSEMIFGFGLIMVTVLLGPISFIIAMITNILSRKAEYKADQFSTKYVDKNHMISALKVLANENYADLNPHKAYAFVYYSHPDLSNRLRAISEGD
ncbi:MAG: M48 family metallopeptidase [Candidatus Izemoplasmataceae bacterium]